MAKTKYINEYNRGYQGNPFKNRYIIVYENKTFYYCKVNGTDELKRIEKNNVDKGNSIYFTSNYEGENISTLKNRLLEYEKERLMHQVSWKKTCVLSRENDIKKDKKDIEELNNAIKNIEEQIALNSDNKV